MEPNKKAGDTPLQAAQVAKITELVDYQSGSVIARKLFQMPTGSVTLFAFEEGQGLSEHTVPLDALVHILEGDAEISIAGQPHRLQGGEMILLPANQPHAVKALKRFKMILTKLRS